MFLSNDIDAVKDLGVQGVVLASLTDNGDVDLQTMKRLIQVSRPLQITFHREFDTTRDPMTALDAIIDLGIDRLLTSGQRSTAAGGLQLIIAMATLRKFPSASKRPRSPVFLT